MNKDIRPPQKPVEETRPLVEQEKRRRIVNAGDLAVTFATRGFGGAPGVQTVWHTEGFDNSARTALEGMISYDEPDFFSGKKTLPVVHFYRPLGNWLITNKTVSAQEFGGRPGNFWGDSRVFLKKEFDQFGAHPEDVFLNPALYKVNNPNEYGKTQPPELIDLSELPELRPPRTSLPELLRELSIIPALENREVVRQAIQDTIIKALFVTSYTRENCENKQKPIEQSADTPLLLLAEYNQCGIDEHGQFGPVLQLLQWLERLLPAPLRQYLFFHTYSQDPFRFRKRFNNNAEAARENTYWTFNFTVINQSTPLLAVINANDDILFLDGGKRKNKIAQELKAHENVWVQLYSKFLAELLLNNPPDLHQKMDQFTNEAFKNTYDTPNKLRELCQRLS